MESTKFSGTKIVRFWLIVFFMSVLFACSSREYRDEPLLTVPAIGGEPAFLKWKERSAPFELEPVFFEYKKHTLSAEAKKTIRRNVEWLKKHPEAKAQLEGQCDERGSREYNLVLGEKRAEAVRQYMETLGIEADRLSVISYGAIGQQEQKNWSRYRTAATFIILPSEEEEAPEPPTAE